ncbi:MAG: hypothetical protein QOH91_2624 [Mycobacterium sp.]|jgi:hypothetical protein|nr:hypothetical protein [Mycobacterium sp.]
MNDETAVNELFDGAGTDFLESQINDRARHRKLTMLSVVCHTCGKPLLEIVATRPQWLMRVRERRHSTTRRETDDSMYSRPEGMSSDDWAREIHRRRRTAGVTNPRGRGPWISAVFNKSREDRQITETIRVPPSRVYVQSVCDCGPWDTTMDWLYRQLDEGKGQQRRVAV